MFEEDMHSVLRYFNSIEDVDIMTVDPSILQEVTESGEPAFDRLGLPHPQLIPQEFFYLFYHPLYNVVLCSRNKMLEIVEDAGQRAMEHLSARSFSGLCRELEYYLKDQTSVRLLSSQALRKERSQVRILKAKSRLITHIQRLITSDMGTQGGTR